MRERKEKAKWYSSRTTVIFAGVCIIVTLYSLSELHRISAAHIGRDDVKSDFGGARSKNLAARLGDGTGSSVALGGEGAAAVVNGVADRTKCFVYENTELWGDVITWGPQNKKASAGECCEAARKYVAPEGTHAPNVWVWNHLASSPHFQECWLKHLAHPEAAKPAKEGPGVEWTAGTLGVDIRANPSITSANKVVRKFHTVTSAQGNAVHWQMRIHYYHFKKQKYACEQASGVKCEMGGFTRLLHSGQADDLMDEIPTMVVDPLPSDTVEHSWYVVLNRPFAFVQWVKKQSIPEKYVLMSEPDHIFIRPMPNFMTSEDPAAFPFFYIEPGSPKNAKITQKFTGPLTLNQLDEIAPIGNSPTFMTLKDMAAVMPLWMNKSIDIFQDAEASKEWGWVQEMYGFCIGLWLGGVKHVNLHMHMMAQPPWDDKLDCAAGKPFHIIHYTYGMDYNLEGEFTPGKYGQWRFDKRAYTGRPLPRHLLDPPANMKNELVRTLMNAFEEATVAIPCWDAYQSTGKIPEVCTEEAKHFLALEKSTG